MYHHLWLLWQTLSPEDECHIKKRESDKLKRQEAERQKTQTPTKNPQN